MKGLTKKSAAISTSPFSPGTDDIGDVSWVVPTVQLRYPANMLNLPGHHWSNAMAMATPIAHKGVVCGAKVLAATVLDLLLKPELIVLNYIQRLMRTITQQIKKPLFLII